MTKPNWSSNGNIFIVMQDNQRVVKPRTNQEWQVMIYFHTTDDASFKKQTKPGSEDYLNNKTCWFVLGNAISRDCMPRKKKSGVICFVNISSSNEKRITIQWKWRSWSWFELVWITSSCYAENFMLVLIIQWSNLKRRNLEVKKIRIKAKLIVKVEIVYLAQAFWVVSQRTMYQGTVIITTCTLVASLGQGLKEKTDIHGFLTSEPLDDDAAVMMVI